jgi:hypothetical protein
MIILGREDPIFSVAEVRQRIRELDLERIALISRRRGC